MSKLELIQKIFQIINIPINSIDDLNGHEIDRDTLLMPNVKEEYLKIIPKVKKFYNSSKLTSLHKNCQMKQKNHSINFIRQILKCNDFTLKPKIISLGYSKNGKKIVKRSYIITPKSSELLNKLPSNPDIKTFNNNDNIIKGVVENIILKITSS
jgi:hypothetical protein